MEHTHRFQNKLTTSSFLLPVAAIICFFLWVLGFSFENYLHWLGMLVCVLSTMLIMELNNTYMLIRTRTRMVATTFLTLWSICSFLMTFQVSHISVLSFLISYHGLFSSYQKHEATGTCFFIFFSLGIASIIVQPLCVFILPFFITLAYYQSLTLKSFFAGLMGFCLPFWLAFSTCFLIDRTDLALSYVANYSQWIPFQYENWTLQHAIVLALVLIPSIPGIIHFIQYRFQDKIKVQSYFYFLLWIECILLIGIVILPSHFKIWLLLLIMNSSPFIAHFFTLTYSKYTNIFFLVMLALLIVYLIYDRWIFLFNFY